MFSVANRFARLTPSRTLRPMAACALALTMVACASIERIAHTQQDQAAAQIPGIPNARVWSDDPNMGGRDPGTRQHIVLALSGGGPDGAFGAGFLNGWTARGGRPNFTVVTGASAGALMAPFAFLGPSHDERMKQAFYSGDMANLLQLDAVAGLVGAGLFNPEPLRQVIAKYIDADILAGVAREHRTGRRLFIVTTNLDAQRTAVWDMGAIASSNDPKALELFRSVMAASASIPGVFPPVLIEVEGGGKRFTEMHVDGGITTNVLVLPEAMMTTNRAMPTHMRPKFYVILNGKLGPNFELVNARTLPITIRSFETSVRANTHNTLLATYEFIKRRGWNLNLTAIEDSVPPGKNRGFDAEYMRRLFDYGYERAARGQMWQPSPADPLPRRPVGPVAQRVAAQ